MGLGLRSLIISAIFPKFWEKLFLCALITQGNILNPKVWPSSWICYYNNIGRTTFFLIHIFSRFLSFDKHRCYINFFPIEVCLERFGQWNETVGFLKKTLLILSDPDISFSVFCISSLKKSLEWSPCTKESCLQLAFNSGIFDPFCILADQSLLRRIAFTCHVIFVNVLKTSSNFTVSVRLQEW